MKLYKIFFSIILLLNTIVIIAQGDKPLVFSIDANTISINKSKLKNKEILMQQSYAELIKQADKALKYKAVSVMEKNTIPPSGNKHDYMSLAPYFWPNPETKDGLPYIRKDGQTNPEVKQYKDKDYFPRLCDNISTLALTYYFSEENKYADKAVELIKVWFLDTATKMNPNLNYAQAVRGQNDGRGAGLIDARGLIKVVDAVGLIQHSKYWSSNNQIEMQRWFADFLSWMQTSKNGKDEGNAKNNHGVWYDAQILSYALFTNQKELASKIVEKIKVRLDKQMDEEGFFPAELERTISLHYSLFVNAPFYLAAQMSSHCNENLWTYVTNSGKSYKKGFDALMPYVADNKKWEKGEQIKPLEAKSTLDYLARGVEKFDCKICGEKLKLIVIEKPESSIIYLTIKN